MAAPLRRSLPALAAALVAAASLFLPGPRPLSAAEAPVAESFDLELGGWRQRVLLRGPGGPAPVLIYLHGGPGRSLIPYAHVSTEELAKRMYVVHYDQRGAGLSYSPSIPPASMTRERLLLDLRELVGRLKARLGAEKVFLLGHSWGSVLGLEYAMRWPGDLAGYIGAGQLVSNRRQSEAARRRMLAMGGFTAEERWKLSRPGGYDRELAAGAGGESGDLTAEDLRRMREASPWGAPYTDALAAAGLEFSARFLWRGMLLDDFGASCKSLAVPVLLLSGGRDLVTEAGAARAWLLALDAPLKREAYFPACAHRMDVEDPAAFQRAIESFVDEVGRGSAPR